MIFLDGLPRRARFVELRRGTKVELLRIFEGAGVRLPLPSGERVPRTDDGEGVSDNRGAVCPKEFADDEAIGSTVALRTRRGPLVAFGPRLAPLSVSYLRNSA